jgi:type VI secretion system protein ImpA
MPALDLESLLAPLAGDEPCGANLEYDPVFQALEEAAAGKPERQYDTVYPAEPPDWPVVHELALSLAARTRDLRVAVWLIRSGARVEGLAAALQGLQLLHGLVDRHWDHVHPKLDAADGNDPTARLNAFAPLAHDAGLGDLRSAGLTPLRGSITVRDLELAFGNAEARPGEPVPTREGSLPAVIAACATVPELSARMTQGAELVQSIEKALDARLSTAQSLHLGPLRKLLDSVAAAGRAAQSSAAPGDAQAAAAATDPTTQAVGAVKPTGAIQSREDAIRSLQRVSEWIERNEPGHPAPLLIQRAQRLMKKNFMEIIRDLVPDGLGQIEKLAGPGRE